MFGTFLQGVRNAYGAFTRTFEDPFAVTSIAGGLASSAGGLTGRDKDYPLLWAYYSNQIFDNIRLGYWSSYKAKYGLYRQTRPIYNPVKRLVEFYVAGIYGGILSEDGQPLPKEVNAQLAIPFSADTNKRLTKAVAQTWDWSNFQSLKSVLARYGASLGDVLVEIVDDVERGKIYYSVIFPAHVAEISLDECGNVVSYVIEKQIQKSYSQNGISTLHNSNGTGIRTELMRQYTYRKEISKDRIVVSEDGVETYNQPNNYGFVPAVWIRHKEAGSIFGIPAMAGSFPLIDELNSTASNLNDQVRKKFNAPFMLFSSADAESVMRGLNNPKRGSTANQSNVYADQESLPIIKGPPDGKIEWLTRDVDFKGAMEIIQSMLKEIENEFPEVGFWNQLRQMQEVTGPAASRLMGDVEQKLSETASNYDTQLKKLFQMGVAIAGLRANDGSWSLSNAERNMGMGLTPQQSVFRPFGLDSYQAGKLDMTILPRPLIRPTLLEEMQSEQMYWGVVGTKKQLGIPLNYVLRRDGWSEPDLAELQNAIDEQEAANLEKAQALLTQPLENNANNLNQNQEDTKQNGTAEPKSAAAGK